MTPVSRSSCDLVIIIPPAGPRHGNYPPYGAMYIASSLRQKGYSACILNVDTERYTNGEVIRKIRDLQASCIGFSGIVAPSYSYIKDLSFELRKAYPEKMQILGGGLSSAAETVLKNTAVDIVVYGEGDETIQELMDCLKNKSDLSAVRGIYYKNGGSLVFSGKRPLISNLDRLPYPAFDLIEMDEYLPDAVKFIKSFTTSVKDERIYKMRQKGRNRMMTLMMSRGCFGKCSFCFRAYPGLRAHSMKYIFDYIDYCIDKFNVGFFTFADECFAANKNKNWEFIKEFQRRKPDIVFRILGMRADTVDEDILKAYKEIGCWMIEYGFESGSPKMLGIIDKEITVEHNRDVFLWTRRAGIFTMPTSVLAMPGETDQTVDETIKFLKSLNLDFKQYQWSYALPIPGSHLYDYAKITGAIENDDEYLYSLKGPVGHGGVFHVNLTDEPDEIVAGWDDRIRAELDSHFFKTRYKAAPGLAANLIKAITLIGLHYRRSDLSSVIINRIRSILGLGGKKEDKKTIASFHKKKKISLESFFQKYESSGMGKEMSLKSINQRLRETVI